MEAIGLSEIALWSACAGVGGVMYHFMSMWINTHTCTCNMLVLVGVCICVNEGFRHKHMLVVYSCGVWVLCGG